MFRQTDPSDLVYVVESGSVGIFRELADGSEEPLADMTEGGYFGELDPLLNLPRSASARAMTQTKLLGYGVAQFRAVFR